MPANMSVMNRRDDYSTDNLDFYPTPPDATQALLKVWRPPEGEVVWEPACGDGAICKVVEDHGYKTIATDLVDRGYGPAETGIDFLTTEKRSKYIITNPPFSLAGKFIKRCRFVDVDGVAMLLKCQFWHTIGREQLFRSYRPAAILAINWRLQFEGFPAANPVDYIWIVWDKRASGYGVPTTYDILGRPVRKRRRRSRR